MILTLDIGNSQIHGALFSGDSLVVQFRKSTKQGTSSDEIGLFLKHIVREHHIKPEEIEKIAICSVVPDLIHSVGSACVKYFHTHAFLLRAGVKTGLKIKYRNPLEVGSDRIANAIAATNLFPNRDLIVVDFGTATTFCAITANRDYLGGVILPGLRLSMEALVHQTAQLPAVQITDPSNAIGRSTTEAIQSGLFYGNVHQAKGFIKQIQEEGFAQKSTSSEPPLIIGTGGFARLFENQGIFDHHIPELVHLGLRDALRINHDPKKGSEHAAKYAEI